MTLPDEVYNFTRITQDEEIELFRKFREEGDLAARDRVVKCYIRYGMKVARRTLGNTPTDEELLSIVGVATMRAMGSSFDPKKSRFSTYLTFHVRRECYSVYNFRLPVTISSRAYTRMMKAGAVMERITLTEDGEPMISEGGNRDNWTDTIIRALRESLVTEDKVDLDREKLEEVMRAGLLTLTPRERETILGKYWDEETFETAGGRMGCSREWARRIHDSGVAKLTKYMQKALGVLK